MPVFGLEDLEYMQRTPEKGLITKQEARALSLAKLRLKSDAIVWDIGAGSGSVGLECARLAPHGHVWAIEKNAGDGQCARQRRPFPHRQLHAVRRQGAGRPRLPGRTRMPHSSAVPAANWATLIRLILTRLKPAGRLVMNFVTLENLATATGALKAAGAVWDVVQLQASRSQPILDMHRLAAQNPVWIVTASKENEA
jgi:precorrin-6Y C5,15-methyltransferase (decarboxylating)